MSTPMIAKFLCRGTFSPEEGEAFRDEVETLLAERDALTVKLEDALRRIDDEKALRFDAMRPAARRLREYKGVTYQDGAFHYSAHWSPRFSAIRACVDFICTADDADHAALLDIKANPYEPVETLEDVVREWLRSHSFRVENEPFTDLCTRLRTWMAQQTPTAALGGAP